MKKELEEIIRLLSQVSHRDLSIYEISFLEKALEKRLAHNALKSAADYRRYLAGNTAEVEAFIDSLTVTYSEFFRDPFTFTLLEKLVLHQLFQQVQRSGRAEIRVWSAGCAAGQEAYSLAILMDELLSRFEHDFTFRIFASDNCQAALDAAQYGIYEIQAVQNVRLKHLLTCFTHENGNYCVAPRLRESIDFSFHDLLDQTSACPPSSIYGDFDLIICSNLLMYYRPEVRQFIMHRLSACLSPEGFFICSEAEKTWVKQTSSFNDFAPLAAVFQKTQRDRTTGVR